VLAGLGPNQVSIISACFSYLAIVLVALVSPVPWVGVLIALLLIVGYAFDSADGQVARLTGRGSVAGEWLDHVIDAAKIVALHCAIAVCWYRFFDVRPALLLVPLGYAVVASVFFFAIVLADLLRRIARVKAGGSAVTTASVSPKESAPWLRSLLALPYDYGLLCIAMAFLGVHTAFVAIYVVLFVGNVLSLVAGCVRWFVEMRTL
jgi:phosphatidylglycerophosphate synthase